MDTTELKLYFIDCDSKIFYVGSNVVLAESIDGMLEFNTVDNLEVGVPIRNLKYYTLKENLVGDLRKRLKLHSCSMDKSELYDCLMEDPIAWKNKVGNYNKKI